MYVIIFSIFNTQKKSWEVKRYTFELYEKKTMSKIGQFAVKM